MITYDIAIYLFSKPFLRIRFFFSNYLFSRKIQQFRKFLPLIIKAFEMQFRKFLPVSASEILFRKIATDSRDYLLLFHS